MSSIRLHRGVFGHVSVLNVTSDFVTHAHHEAHIILWLDGAAGIMTIGNEKVQLGHNVAAAINALQPHSHALAQDGRPGQFLAFYIDSDWANLRRNRPIGARLFSRPVIEIDHRLHAMAATLFVAMCAGNSTDDIIDNDILRLIDGLLASADRSLSRKVRIPSADLDYDFRVRKAIKLMQTRVGERICLDAVARSAGLSRPRLFALFKEQIKLTPSVYWNTLRMEEALRQISWSRDSLTCVAGNLGFTTQGNFTRFFRDHAGVPPTIYREAARLSA